MSTETVELFREDAYLRECEASVTAVTPLGGDAAGVSHGVAGTGDADSPSAAGAAKSHALITDRSVFYPEGGGQPGDTGVLHFTDSAGNPREIRIGDTQKAGGAILHLCDPAAELPSVGARVTLKIDWERRHRLMRMHSCMHMLCAAISAPVTGGSIRDGSARLDFNLPNPPNKQELEAKINKLIEENHPMRLRWIRDAELDAQPELVRTMSVQPPRGGGRIRLVEFEGADLQPCGGTHVATTAEIGAVRVASIKSKGKQNRRIIVEFA